MTITREPTEGTRAGMLRPRARTDHARSNRWTWPWILRRLPWWTAALLMTGGCLLWVYPFAWMVAASLKSQLEIFGSGLSLIPDSPAWENYGRAWNDAGFAQYMLNTVIVTFATVILVVLRCATAGYVLGRYSFRGRKLIMAILLITLVAPTGYTIIPVVDISMKLGLLNSLTGMVVALSGSAHVVGILLYAGYFRSIPKELQEAAILDGAGFFTIFFKVMLPMARPVTATVVLTTFLATWNAYFLPLVFTFSRPELRTLSVGMTAFVGENSTDWSGMAAAATISLLPVVILFILMQRQFIDGIAGAVKS